MAGCSAEIESNIQRLEKSAKYVKQFGTNAVKGPRAKLQLLDAFTACRNSIDGHLKETSNDRSKLLEMYGGSLDAVTRMLEAASLGAVALDACGGRKDELRFTECKAKCEMLKRFLQKSLRSAKESPQEMPTPKRRRIPEPLAATGADAKTVGPQRMPQDSGNTHKEPMMVRSDAESVSRVSSLDVGEVHVERSEPSVVRPVADIVSKMNEPDRKKEHVRKSHVQDEAPSQEVSMVDTNKVHVEISEPSVVQPLAEIVSKMNEPNSKEEHVEKSHVQAETPMQEASPASKQALLIGAGLVKRPRSKSCASCALQ